MPVITDTTNLTNFCRDVARHTPGVKFWDAMIHEVGKVLEGCVRLTLGDKWKITRSVENKNRTLNESGSKRSPIIYVTKAGLIWFADYPGAGYEGVATGRKTGSGKTFHPMSEFFYYGNPRWVRYQQFLMDLRNKQIEVRMVMGRAAQSWVQIAEALGVKINVPGYVRDASPFRGRRRTTGFARRMRSVNGAIIAIENINPVLLGTIDGGLVLRKSIKGRLQYFRHGITEGYLNDVRATAVRHGLKAA